MLKKYVVMYADGSAKPNPGNAGFGVYGYSFIKKENKRQYKHPSNNIMYFTVSGILPEKTTEQIELIDIYEHIEFIRGNTSTNNCAELKAAYTAISKIIDDENVVDLVLMTDSSYVVNGINDYVKTWVLNNWKRLDGKEIAHINEWKLLYTNYMQLIDKGINITIKWVKGHSENYGNEIADIYSIIASNASMVNTKEKIDNTIILDQKTTFNEYSKSFNNKEFMYSFKNLYFNSSIIEDNIYSFLYNTGDKDLNMGKRNIESLFALNIGDTPETINKLRAIHRKIPRTSISTCCININKLANKDIFRLINLIEPIYLLNKLDNTTYSLLRDNNPFIYDVKYNVPLMTDINIVFDKLLFISECSGENTSDIFELDITDIFLKDKKLVQTNKEQKIDITELVTKTSNINFNIKQKLILTMGRDLPTYLMFKNIENKINKILLCIHMDKNNNMATIYCKFILNNRVIVITNILNKFSVSF